MVVVINTTLKKQQQLVSEEKKKKQKQQQQQQQQILSLEQEQILLGSSNNNNNKIITDFQRKVYIALCQVPKGYVTTYKLLAKYINCNSNQAIGQALRRNPYAPIIPCHRVISTNGTIGGFGGMKTGDKIDHKIHLLKSEGVQFIRNKKDILLVVDLKCIYTFS